MRTLARDRDAAEILSRLRALRVDSTGRWGRMSAHQMVCHLSDGYRLLTGELTSPLVAAPLPRAVMKWVALYVPVRWPSGIRTTPEIDQVAGGGTRPGEFAADVAAVDAAIAAITGAPEEFFRGRRHPIFGPLTQSAWLRWAYLHMDHHLRQFGV